MHFEIKLSKAKLKHLQLLHLENKKKWEKYTKAFNKTENGALLLFQWHTNLKWKTQKTDFLKVTIKFNNKKHLSFPFSFSIFAKHKKENGRFSIFRFPFDK